MAVHARIYIPGRFLRMTVTRASHEAYCLSNFSSFPGLFVHALASKGMRFVARSISSPVGAEIPTKSIGK